jgi:cardiolipin synthase A/B
VPLREGNLVEVVNNGRVFDVLEEEILRARQSVHVTVYIWRPSEPSERVVRAIEQVTRAGVACRVIVDPLGSVDFEEQVRPRLVAAGCDVRFFRQITEDPAKALGRNHRKLLVVDGKVGVTGGFGIWKAWQGNGRAEEEWRETNVRFTGPAVRDLQVAFARDWSASGGPLLPDVELPELPVAGPVPGAFVSSAPVVGVTNAERLTVLMFTAARKRLWISNAYFTPSKPLLQLLEKKRQEGVEIRVLAPGPVHDVPPIRSAQRGTYERLLKAGVRVWEYQPSMMHAKTLVVDDDIGVVGSINLDPLSLNQLEEGALVFESQATVAQLAHDFEEDLTVARELKLGDPEVNSNVNKFSRALMKLFGRSL